MNNIFSLGMVAAITALTACGASAATWVATKGSVGHIDLIAGADSFSDGVFNTNSLVSATTEKVLISTSLTPTGIPSISLNFTDLSIYYGANAPTAPRVDLLNMQGYFNSLYIMGWFNTGVAAVGTDIGLSGSVPLVANQDGSYTATWIAPVGHNGNGWDMAGKTVEFTFRAAVPEAPVWLLFGLGLPLLMGSRFRRSQAL